MASVAQTKAPPAIPAQFTPTLPHNASLAGKLGAPCCAPNPFACSLQIRVLARVPTRWTHLADKNSRMIKSLSMILFAKMTSTFVDQTLVLLAHLNEFSSLRHNMCISDCFVSDLGRVVDVVNGVCFFLGMF